MSASILTRLQFALLRALQVLGRATEIRLAYFLNEPRQRVKRAILGLLYRGLLQRVRISGRYAVWCAV